jgi:MFS family permease
MKKYLQLGAVYLTSFSAWFFVVPLVVYGHITNSFPGLNSLTILMMTLPYLFAMVGGFAAMPLARTLSKKSIVILALFLSLSGGLIISFMGTDSLTFALVGAAITGIPAGLIPSVNNVVLPVIAPERLRVKVIGFNYAMLTLGMVIVSALSGILASEGDWARAYNVFYIIIPIIFIAVIFYPKVEHGTMQESASASKIETKNTNSSPISILFSIPTFVFALLVVRFIAAFFYMGIPLNASEYFINDRQISSSLVGMGASIANLFAIFGTAFVFVWLRMSKECSLMMALVLCATAGLACLTLPNIYANMLGWVLAGIGALIFSASVNTLLVLGFKGRVAEAISSLCIIAMFAGEFLAGYVSPMISQLLLGGASASANIKVASVGCIIIGLVSIPFCNTAYRRLVSAEKSVMRIQNAM